MGAVLLPPQIIPLNGPLVFLAGPIQGAPDWQADALRWFQAQAQELAVASPRRAYPPGAFDYAAQVDWETYHLRRAAQCGVILFWLVRSSQRAEPVLWADQPVRASGVEGATRTGRCAPRRWGRGWFQRDAIHPASVPPGLPSGPVGSVTGKCMPCRGRDSTSRTVGHSRPTARLTIL